MRKTREENRNANTVGGGKKAAGGRNCQLNLPKHPGYHGGDGG